MKITEMSYYKCLSDKMAIHYKISDDVLSLFCGNVSPENTAVDSYVNDDMEANFGDAVRKIIEIMEDTEDIIFRDNFAMKFIGEVSEALTDKIQKELRIDVLFAPAGRVFCFLYGTMIAVCHKRKILFMVEYGDKERAEQSYDGMLKVFVDNGMNVAV